MKNNSERKLFRHSSTAPKTNLRRMADIGVLYTMLVVPMTGCHVSIGSAPKNSGRSEGGLQDAGSGEHSDATTGGYDDATLYVDASRGSPLLSGAARPRLEADAASTEGADSEVLGSSDATVSGGDAGADSALLPSDSDASGIQQTDSGSSDADGECPREPTVSVACGPVKCTGATPFCCSRTSGIDPGLTCVASVLSCLDGLVRQCDDWSDCPVGQRCEAGYNKGLSIPYPPTCAPYRPPPGTAGIACVYKNECECQP